MAEYVTPETAEQQADVTGELDSNEAPVTGVTYNLSVTINSNKELVEAIEAYVQTYTYIPPNACHTVTLWVLHTWLIDAADVTPYLRIRAAQKQSGKTTLMDTLSQLAARAIPTSHITAAGMRRIMDSNPPPTLLFDEVDPIFTKKREETAELQAVIDAGYRRGAKVTIVDGGKGGYKLKEYQVFGPKVLVSIGQLPDPIESRSIHIILERMARTERRKRFRQREAEALAVPIRMYLSALDSSEIAQSADVPDELSGRQADIWEPLLAIADWLGGEWPQMARDAAIDLNLQKEDDSEGSALLRHIKEVFEEHGPAGLRSAELVHLLLENEEWPYIRIVDGNRPLDAVKLAAMLKPFGIRPVQMRLYTDATQVRGYWRVAFEDAWARYL